MAMATHKIVRYGNILEFTYSVSSNIPVRIQAGGKKSEAMAPTKSANPQGKKSGATIATSMARIEIIKDRDMADYDAFPISTHVIEKIFTSG
jgi:hypothetical protein